MQINHIKEVKSNPQNFMYIGVDIHKDKHTAIITNCFEQQLAQIDISNKEDDFKSFCKTITKLSKANNLTPLFGLEDSYGYGKRLAEYLFTNNFVVKMVSPVLVDKERNHQNHVEKTDTIDAYGVAKVLIKRIDTLPQYSLTNTDANAKELKELVNDRDFLVKEQTRIKNQLHRLLHLVYNSDYKTIFKNTFTIQALTYWIEHSSTSVTGRQIARKCKRLLDIREELKQISLDMESLLEESGQKLHSMNGCGITLAAKVVAEVRNINRFKKASSFIKYSGLCPREKSSGKCKRHVKTKAGNRELNKAIHRIAIAQLGNQGNKIAKDYFLRKQQEGKTKVQSLCSLKRRLGDIIYLMMRDKKEYNYNIK